MGGDASLAAYTAVKTEEKMEDKVEVLMVQVSIPPAEAPALARRLVEARLAACVQLLPGVRSIYRWEGAIEEAEETLLLIKSTKATYPHLERAIREHHSYQVPEVVGFVASEVSPAYARWVLEEVRGPA